MDPSKDSADWFALLDLIQHCPGEVPDADGDSISIKGATRLVLHCLGHHANGKTNKTWVSLATIIEETQCNPKTVDRAIAALKRAGIISAVPRISANGTWLSNLWTIHRELLQRLAGDRLNDDVLIEALEAVRTSGGCQMDYIPVARLQQTRSRLCHLAGDLRLLITEEISEIMKTATLAIRAERLMEVDVLDAAEPDTAEPDAAPVTVRLSPAEDAIVVSETQPIDTTTEPVSDFSSQGEKSLPHSNYSAAPISNPSEEANIIHLPQEGACYLARRIYKLSNLPVAEEVVEEGAQDLLPLVLAAPVWDMIWVRVEYALRFSKDQYPAELIGTEILAKKKAVVIYGTSHFYGDNSLRSARFSPVWTQLSHHRVTRILGYFGSPFRLV